jgi:uncharacterized protein YjlB
LREEQLVLGDNVDDIADVQPNRESLEASSLEVLGHEQTLAVHVGDVLVLPASTGHCNVGASDDLLVVGAYPDGMNWDIRRGDPAERNEVPANIHAVPLPRCDPVEGGGGPLDRLW